MAVVCDNLPWFIQQQNYSKKCEMNEGHLLVLKDALDPRRARLAIKFPPNPERQNHFGGFHSLSDQAERRLKYIFGDD